jgi:hypothetical protein
VSREERYEYCLGKTRLRTDIGGGIRDGDSVASDLLGNLNHIHFLQDLLDFYFYKVRPKTAFFILLCSVLHCNLFNTSGI